MPGYTHHPSSFKDPSGFVFQAYGKNYRQVNKVYAENYELLTGSGLYGSLTEKKLLIPHAEIAENFTQSELFYKTLLPEQIHFISYVYEWSFDQLKDAALLTLRVLKIAVEHGMILKDATPFNIQFREGHPVFIDTLSFEKYDPAKPWIAYRQFCECFLFPLYLEHYLKTDIQKILSTYLEGIPVDVTAKLLPVKSSLNMGVWLHVYLQNNVKEDKTGVGSQANFDKKKLDHLTEHLGSIITRFRINQGNQSTWSNYYRETILSQEYLLEKEKLFKEFIDAIAFSTVLDAGANDGYFSQILARKAAEVIAIDFDNQCINNLYRSIKKNNSKNILPLCIDITNPSPAVGFRNTERQSFIERAGFDLVTALALIHHLVLSKNIPVEDIAAFLAMVTHKFLIIEFVPLSDPKSQELIKNKTGFHAYDETEFENAFANSFIWEKKQIIAGTGRILYLMRKTNFAQL
jgi:2-polyprenyl-3-methyl-5-hydroxy-6-metoxy-1,4-benzoquinol methylase